ncbi:transposase [Rhizobium dioscoreae]|uniref:transposase n=1 Tax=Rhizobium TaxID=379 RepID=UPI003320077B
MRFLGLELSDKVPDAKTIWLFRESLVRSGGIDNLFAPFRQASLSIGLSGHRWSDHSCNDHPGSQAAQQPGPERRAQGW